MRSFGPSGGGKTTICSLLPRFYDITDGSITIGGQNIKDIKLESLRNSIGIVQQDVYLFGGSIKENIAYGNLMQPLMKLLKLLRKPISTILL